MNIKQDNFFPQVHYYDPDFVSIYEQTWSRIEVDWVPPNTENPSTLSGYVDHPEVKTISLIDAITSSFFLLYSNNYLSPTHLLDVFYQHQDISGQIPSAIEKENQETSTKKGHLSNLPNFSSLSNLVLWKQNTEKITPPLLLWAEHNYYNRTENKRRLKEIIPKLDLYLQWFEDSFRQENGLFKIPKNSHYMDNQANKNIQYFIDFNAQMALAYSCMSKLTNFATSRNLSLKYSKLFYQLKALINKHFWHEKDKFYYDLDDNLLHIPKKSISSYWTLLANIPNNNQATALKNDLQNPDVFCTLCPFPSIPVNDSTYSEQGLGFHGTVYPLLTYMTVKGLASYGYYELARESALKHLSCILASFFSEDPELEGAFWECYLPNGFGPAKSYHKTGHTLKNFFPSVGLSTIALIIEIVLGFEVCVHKKMVYWTIPHLEFMGIDGLLLKRNLVSIKLQNTNRGWEIRNGSEKLYYFSVNILEKEIDKTLPIPSGKCSLLVDKL